MKLRGVRALNPALMLLVPVALFPLALLLFVLPASPLLQPGVSVAVPPSNFGFPKKEAVVVSIPAPPSTKIFFQNRQTDLDGLQLALEPLRGKVETIIVRADRFALHEHVTAAVNVLLDAGFSVALAASNTND